MWSLLHLMAFSQLSFFDGGMVDDSSGSRPEGISHATKSDGDLENLARVLWEALQRGTQDSPGGPRPSQP